MKTTLQEAMAAGVFVEFQNSAGNLIGQTIFTGWQGRPLPAVGDTMCCRVPSKVDGRLEKLTGRVVSRHFEVQHDADQPSIWVRLVVVTLPPRPRTQRAQSPAATFSSN
jgi:hypothetical protein